MADTLDQAVFMGHIVTQWLTHSIRLQLWVTLSHNGWHTRSGCIYGSHCHTMADTLDQAVFMGHTMADTLDLAAKLLTSEVVCLLSFT